MPHALLTFLLATAAGAAASSPPEGHSSSGAALRAVAFGHGKTTVYILGGFHGDEPAGSETVARGEALLREQVPSCLERRTLLVVVPILNPDGLRAKTRTNGRGVDLNRNFPTQDRMDTERTGRYAGGASPEPETRWLLNLFRWRAPSLVISLHQPLALVNWDGPPRSLQHGSASCRSCDSHRRSATAPRALSGPTWGRSEPYQSSPWSSRPGRAHPRSNALRRACSSLRRAGAPSSRRRTQSQQHGGEGRPSCSPRRSAPATPARLPGRRRRRGRSRRARGETSPFGACRATPSRERSSLEPVE